MGSEHINSNNSFNSYIRLISSLKNIKSRSIIIVTYALCGFATFGAIGIEIAIMTSFAPRKKADIVKMAGMAMVGGNISAFMNACIAGKFLL